MRKNDSGNFEIAPPAAWMLIGSITAGGAGMASFTIPQIEAESLKACYDNSRTALEVAAQHGQEFNEIRGEVDAIRRLIYDRTQYRWTSEDHAKFSAQQSRIDEIQNRRLDVLERDD